MKVFKFGGASVRDSNGIKNLSAIIRQKLDKGDVVVVSAMGKTTANLESLAIDLLGKNASIDSQLSQIKKFHLSVVEELFHEQESIAYVTKRVVELFDKISYDLNNESRKEKKAFLDGILSYGEILSTSIVVEYLKNEGIGVIWKDIRKFILSDDNFGSARVDWVSTNAKLKKGLPEKDQIVVTQGYIASTAEGKTTTLGKEGSDFSAAIIAKACEAEDVTFWKDVSGVFNADPKIEKDARLFSELSYRQVVEMTYFGAKIIHPKTMRPLAEAGIPLYVKSFLNPDMPGTKIVNQVDEEDTSQIIFKHNQVLVSFKIINLEFIGENNIGLIFYTFDRLGIQVNIIQSSATSCTFAFDWDEERMENLLEALADKFSMYFNKGLTLGTFKNLPSEMVDKYLTDSEVFLKQTTRSKVRILYKEH